MTNPWITVITICYNAEATIEPTLQSVLEQKEQGVPLEYLVIDGASNDRTLEIIDAYQKSDCITLRSEPDEGLYDAMNKGLYFAKGTYVCFMNAGDTFHRADTLLSVWQEVQSLSDTPDVIYGDTILVDTRGKVIGKRHLSAPETLVWQSFADGMLVCHQSFYVRRAIAQKFDLRYRFSADFDWCIRILKASRYNYNSQRVLTNYLNEGITTKNFRKSLWERYRIMKGYFGVLPTSIRHIKFLFRYLLNCMSR